jgi:hypothetical protein
VVAETKRFEKEKKETSSSSDVTPVSSIEYSDEEDKK